MNSGGRDTGRPRWNLTGFQKFGAVVAIGLLVLLAAAFAVRGPASQTTTPTTETNPPATTAPTSNTPTETAHTPESHNDEPDMAAVAGAGARLAAATALFSSAPTAADAAYELRVLMAAPGLGIPESVWTQSLRQIAVEDPEIVEGFRDRLATGQDWQSGPEGRRFHIVPMCHETHPGWGGAPPAGLDDINSVHMLLQWWEGATGKAWTTTQVLIEIGLGRDDTGAWRWFGSEEVYFMAPLPMTDPSAEFGLQGTGALYDLLRTCETY